MIIQFIDLFLWIIALRRRLNKYIFTFRVASSDRSFLFYFYKVRSFSSIDSDSLVFYGVNCSGSEIAGSDGIESVLISTGPTADISLGLF